MKKTTIGHYKTAVRQAAGHIILSVAEGISYDRLESHGRLGRLFVGRPNFYGMRGCPFRCLDVALKERQVGLDG